MNWVHVLLHCASAPRAPNACRAASIFPHLMDFLPVSGGRVVLLLVCLLVFAALVTYAWNKFRYRAACAFEAIDRAQEFQLLAWKARPSVSSPSPAESEGFALPVTKPSSVGIRHRARKGVIHGCCLGYIRALRTGGVTSRGALRMTATADTAPRAPIRKNSQDMQSTRT